MDNQTHTENYGNKSTESKTPFVEYYLNGNKYCYYGLIDEMGSTDSSNTKYEGSVYFYENGNIHTISYSKKNTLVNVIKEFNEYGRMIRIKENGKMIPITPGNVTQKSTQDGKKISIEEDTSLTKIVDIESGVIKFVDSESGKISYFEKDNIMTKFVRDEAGNVIRYEYVSRYSR